MRKGKLMVLLMVVAVGCSTMGPGEPAQKQGSYAFGDYVWPPPPDRPRIKLAAILRGRSDVESDSRLATILIGASPQSIYDRLRRPFGVAYDREGRLLVTDSGSGALFRFDRENRRLDVFGTSGSLRLKNPLGLAVAGDGSIYVADIGLRKVVAFDAAGRLVTAFGKAGELLNPTDVAVSPDDARLYVADSKAHKIVVLDRASGQIISSFGTRGSNEGEFGFPTSLSFSTTGELCVVDQLNARVQVFSSSGEFLTQFGARGIGFGNFVRPKDIAFDREGLIYVTDAAFSNVQIFSPELQLLTFVGEFGSAPGQFQNAGGVAAYKNEFAVVDQLGSRVEIFRFIAPKSDMPTGRSLVLPTARSDGKEGERK